MENNITETDDSYLPDESYHFDNFKKSYGEEFTDALNIDTWQIDRNLARLYAKIERELFDAKHSEMERHQTIRDQLFPVIKERMEVPHAGLHEASLELIEKMHKGFLFNGAVTACGSFSMTYDSLPISITQMGICLVNYQGEHGSYSHQLFRRDLKFTHSDPVKDAVGLIERRRTDDRTKLNNLAMWSIKAYAERAILLEKSEAKWLLGHGLPAPNELMMGFWANQEEVKDKTLSMLQQMISEHKRFVYVQPGTLSPELWAFGNALKPFEYLVIDTMEDKMVQMVNAGHTRLHIRRAYEEFARYAGSQIVYGVYRVSKLAPPQIFYCHIEHIRTGALIAMADSALQLHAGTPMLLDLAGNLCRNAFGKNDLMTSIDQANIRAEVLTKLTVH